MILIFRDCAILRLQGSDGLNSVGDQVETEYSSALTLKEVITALG
jgi:hypothetical protein